MLEALVNLLTDDFGLARVYEVLLQNQLSDGRGTDGARAGVQHAVDFGGNLRLHRGVLKGKGGVSYCLSALYIYFCICQSQIPNPYLPYPASLLATTSLFSI